MLYVALGILTMDDDDIDVGWGGIVVSLLVQVQEPPLIGTVASVGLRWWPCTKMVKMRLA